jgi:uncharacterized protein (DUF736 family)
MPKASKKAPDYRVLTGTTEIGAAWKKTSAAANPYLAVRLDDPSFPAPVFCRPVETQDRHRLMWSRETKRRGIEQRRTPRDGHHGCPAQASKHH